MKTLFLIAAALVVLATVLPLWRHPAWWVRVWDFPRLQLAILSAALLVSTVAALEVRAPFTWILLVSLSGALLYQSWWIVPYTRLFPPEVKAVGSGDPARRLRIMVANVLTPNRQAHLLLNHVREHRPDVLLAVETDRWWESRLDALEPEYPHSLKCPLDNLYGMHLYSRLPLEDARIQFLVEPDIPSMHALVVLPGGDRVRLHFVHPAPPSPTENEESSERDAELIAVGKSVADAEGPVVVAGDLNDVAWSSTTRLFRKISRLLDPRLGRGMYNTFHARWFFLRWPLDHLFHSGDLAPIRLRRLGAIGSDHFPLLAELQLVSEPVSEAEGLEADEEDHDRAEEKLAEEGADEDAVHAPREGTGAARGRAGSVQEGRGGALPG